MLNRDDLLDLLVRDARTPHKELAKELGVSEAEVKQAIQELESDRTIISYTTLINKETPDSDQVTALLEVKCTPQREKGYNAIARQLYQYPQVRDCYLMSGGFDIMLIISGQTLKEVAMFVSEKIAGIEGVTGTKTSFILKNYKFNGVIVNPDIKDSRERIVL